MAPRRTLQSVADDMRLDLPPDVREMMARIGSIMDFPAEAENRIVRFTRMLIAYENGMPLKEIEARYNCSRSTVLRYARLAGFPKREKGFGSEMRARVIALYKEGMRVEDIAANCHVSIAYVSTVATQEGINRYPK